MTWKKLNDSEPELYYFSEALTTSDIKNDINVVVLRMIKNRTSENVNSESLLFDINATNSQIKIAWFNAESSKLEGMYLYTLKLQPFMNSIESNGGAFQFDDDCDMAIWRFTSDKLSTEEGDIIYRAFVKSEVISLREIDV